MSFVIWFRASSCRRDRGAINGTPALVLLFYRSSTNPAPFPESAPPPAMAEPSLTMRRRTLPEAEKMMTATTILADAGRLIWKGERVDDGDHDGRHGNEEGAGDYVNPTQSRSRWPRPNVPDAGEGRVAARLVAARDYYLGRRMMPMEALLVGDGAEQSRRCVAQYAQLGQRCVSPLGIFARVGPRFFFPPGMAGFGRVWARDSAQPDITERENMVGPRFCSRQGDPRETRPFPPGTGITERGLKELQQKKIPSVFLKIHISKASRSFDSTFLRSSKGFAS
jgi:hypothetical protein